MRRWALGLAVAAVSPLAVAAPPAAASPAVVDCLWAATPQGFRQSLVGTVDSDHFDGLLDGYRPSDAQLTSLADRCHLGRDQAAFHLAALTIISKARLTWAQARLTQVYGLTPAQLEDSWGHVSPQDRATIAHYMETMDGDDLDKLNAPLTAFAAALNATDPDKLMTASAYLYGRSLVEYLGLSPR